MITGFGARIDPRALGYDIEAYLSVRVERHDVKSAQEFRRAIQRYPEVRTCRMMTGDIDFLLRVIARDVRSYGRFVEEKRQQTIYHKNLERVVYIYGETAGRPPAPFPTIPTAPRQTWPACAMPAAASLD